MGAGQLSQDDPRPRQSLVALPDVTGRQLRQRGHFVASFNFLLKLVSASAKLTAYRVVSSLIRQILYAAFSCSAGQPVNVVNP